MRQLDDGPLIVVFHGVLRNAEEYRDHARALAERLGAIVVEHNPLYAREELEFQLADHEPVVAVVWDKIAATVQEVAPADTIVVAVGGGGLFAGITAAAHQRARIVAVEPRSIPTLHAAIEANEPVDVEVSGIAADSLGARRVGAIAFEIAARNMGDAIRDFLSENPAFASKLQKGESLTPEELTVVKEYLSSAQQSGGVKTGFQFVQGQLIHVRN